MVRLIDRGGVACASGFNWCSFILLIFATASGYWSWGSSIPPPGLVPYNSATVSVGPWLAGSLWSSFPVPCSCSNGFCYGYCYVGSDPVRWGAIPAAAACGPQSLVYAKWSGPLGYCSFPGGVSPPLPEFPSNLPNGSSGANQFGNVPEGTVFNTPSVIISIQALSIISVIAVFFAAIAGCVDAGMDKGSFFAAGTATFWSLIGWIFSLSAYCLWSTFPYVQNLQGSSPSTVWMPVWLNQQLNQMTAVQSYSVVYGPGWATALTASIITFFCFLIHCVSLVNQPFPDAFRRDTHENVTPQPRQNGDEAVSGLAKV